jgi:hypothetical protein
MTLDVATPLALPLNGNAAILTVKTAVELSPELSRLDARCCHTWWGRCMCNRWRVDRNWLTGY